MAAQLATIDQFYAFQGLAVPTTLTDEEKLKLNADLVRASDKVRRILRLAIVRWRVSTGLPINTYLAEEIARATVAQQVWFASNGDASGAGNDFDSAALNGVSFSKRASGTAQTPAQKRLAPEAAEILENLPIWSTRSRRG